MRPQKPAILLFHGVLLLLPDPAIDAGQAAERRQLLENIAGDHMDVVGAELLHEIRAGIRAHKRLGKAR